jgi:hypothetical protein
MPSETRPVGEEKRAVECGFLSWGHTCEYASTGRRRLIMAGSHEDLRTHASEASWLDEQYRSKWRLEFAIDLLPMQPAP